MDGAYLEVSTAIVQVGKKKCFTHGALMTLKPNQMMGELTQRNEQ